MKTIQLTKGQVAIVDDEDFDELNKYKWHAIVRDHDYHAARMAGRKYVYMHRQLLGVTNPKLDVDHKNHDGLDNRRNNLRIATRSQNSANARTFRGSSKYKGVHFDSQTKKWRAEVTRNRKKYKLGRFKNEQEAAKAYNEKAKELFGDYANLNAI